MASFLLFHLALLCVLETILSQSTTYTNFWAVQVAGAPSEAQRLANKHGFTFVSQVTNTNTHFVSYLTGFLCKFTP